MINNKKIVAIVSILLLQTFLINSKAQVSDRPLYKNKSFQLYSNRVEQDSFIAKALSRNKIISNYQSPANLYANASISFKFSINGQDNEMGFAIDHHFLCSEKINETPLIVFGRQLKETTSPEPIFLKAKSILKIKLDAREVLRDINEKGYYITGTGAKIYKQDFKGFFIAGGASPLTWDFDNLGARNEFKLDDNDGDGIYTIQIILNDPDAAKKTAAVWETQKSYTDFPIYKSSYLISDAIYNMSIEEMVNAIEPDSTFRTGKEWAGVWTRDISYSIILSMAYLQPKVAMYSLMKKVNKKKRIIQDTGTGGAYPISTDRVVWATAAWEVYKATGDKDWLRDAYQIIKNSIADDIENAYDSKTGLVKGESSFLDWREQTYPRWMQPTDIYQSENLGTNALHYQGNLVLAEMAKLLGNINVYTKHRDIALKIKTGINTYLWLPTKGYYAQYLYGRSFLRASNRSESLGEALCVLFGIADEAQKKSIISKMPVMDFGVPCIYPQIPNITPYHNNAIWPFVQSYYALAAAAVKNEEAVLESVATIYRAAGLFVTNKENMVAENGDFAGTQINSSNMLWSLSGNIALIHKIFFGIQFESNSLSFHPFVPQSFSDTRSLNNFKYRNSVLDIIIEGYGDAIESFMVDGVSQKKYFVTENLTGRHIIKIKLNNHFENKSTINYSNQFITLPAPLPVIKDRRISWPEIKDATYYVVYCNHDRPDSTQSSFFEIKNNRFSEFQIAAIDSTGHSSFLSEPVVFNSNTLLFEIEKQTPPATIKLSGFSGEGFVEIDKGVNETISMSIDVSASGNYLLDFNYANGSGPTNTSNKCAMRSLLVDGKKIGTIVFPQRGNDEWSNWGFSNAIRLKLNKGKHVVSLLYAERNENMNGQVNRAMVDYMRLMLE